MTNSRKAGEIVEPYHHRFVVDGNYRGLIYAIERALNDAVSYERKELIEKMRPVYQKARELERAYYSGDMENEIYPEMDELRNALNQVKEMFE